MAKSGHEYFASDYLRGRSVDETRDYLIGLLATRALEDGRKVNHLFEVETFDTDMGEFMRVSGMAA
jgi:hypothetical protein